MTGKTNWLLAAILSGLIASAVFHSGRPPVSDGTEVDGLAVEQDAGIAGGQFASPRQDPAAQMMPDVEQGPLAHGRFVEAPVQRRYGQQQQLSGRLTVSSDIAVIAPAERAVSSPSANVLEFRTYVVDEFKLSGTAIVDTGLGLVPNHNAKIRIQRVVNGVREIVPSDETPFAINATTEVGWDVPVDLTSFPDGRHILIAELLVADNNRIITESGPITIHRELFTSPQIKLIELTGGTIQPTLPAPAPVVFNVKSLGFKIDASGPYETELLDKYADTLKKATLQVFAVQKGKTYPLVHGTVFSQDPQQPSWKLDIDLKDRRDLAVSSTPSYILKTQLFLGTQIISQLSASQEIRVREGGPTIKSFVVEGLLSETGPLIVTVNFAPDNPLKLVDRSANVRSVEKYRLVPADDKDNFITEAHAFGSDGHKPGQDPEYSRVSNSVRLQFDDIPGGKYVLFVDKSLQDVFGHTLGEFVTHALTRQFGDEPPTVRPGLRGTTGEYVNYREYTEPRDNPEGFNPSDHVETRVARLYFFRDAHRVVQIINRRARSYNRAAVDMASQLADKSRTEADQLTGQRRHSEQEAILAAQATRRAEAELKQEEQKQARATQELMATQQALQPMEHRQLVLETRIKELNDKTSPTSAEKKELDTLTKEQTELGGQVNNATQARNTLDQIAKNADQTISGLRAQVDQLREKENTSRLQMLKLEGAEDRARENQFRREVAAAHEDPDTYAPGKPGSDDPVEQVSVSVIGEGLIQLRGPIKGINIIRNMINQIDAPVGQVRIDVHSLQINGEEGPQMEVVADEMQVYVDQARFLTTQSAELLRRSVVEVAARYAEAACPTGYSGPVVGNRSQAVRDERYLYAFFGADFINELRAMDSEFLHTGNKLLSLHSMDTTSLSSALFLMALAKNTTRAEIMARFHELMRCYLPQAEQQFIEAGLFCSPHCKLGGSHKLKLVPLACNAKFQSLSGFFNADLIQPDTMTPIQREFIRLAQIFKARLITEMELRQRVMERGIIEDRFVSRKQQQEEAVIEEKNASIQLKEVADNVMKQQRKVLEAVAAVQGRIVEVNVAVKENEESAERFVSLSMYMEENRKAAKYQGEINGMHWEIGGDVKERSYTLMPGDKASVQPFVNEVLSAIQVAQSLQSTLAFTVSPQRSAWDEQVEFTQKLEQTVNELRTVRAASDAAKGEFRKNSYAIPLESVRKLAVLIVELRERANIAVEDLDAINRQCDLLIVSSLTDLVQRLSEGQLDIHKIRENWTLVRAQIKAAAPGSWPELETLVGDANSGMNDLLIISFDFAMAQQTAEDSRRPLDHVKFLDMLVDQLEDKHIELLEGTRAHTANIDNYIKRICTALQDDYNRQFYYPSMRLAREASRGREVTFAQLETTGILANNRMLAKVSPQATMEFDLPRRDILLKEGLEGAKAAMDDYGALLNDPTFLSLAAIGSGLPTSSPLGGASGGFGTVRNVLPGLDASSGEQILNQTGPGQSQLGSNLEALIPDPAIYKFETGTGYEIRPVIQPDGQAVVFDFNYMYTTHIREPVRADEKHLGRVKRHFIDTDVQLSNYELREISRYQVAIKASRTARGVPLLEDIPIAGVLFRPLPQQESSLQQNVILGQAVIFPTLFDLMGLRWAPAVSDLDPLRISNSEFLVRNRHRFLQNRVYDYSSSEVDKFLRIPDETRRSDLYRSQESIPVVHPNGYQGQGLDYQRSVMQENYRPEQTMSPNGFIRGSSPEGSRYLDQPRRPGMVPYSPGDTYREMPLERGVPMEGMDQHFQSGGNFGEPIPTPEVQQTPMSSPDLGAPDMGTVRAISGTSVLQVEVAEPAKKEARRRIHNTLRFGSQY